MLSMKVGGRGRAFPGPAEWGAAGLPSQPYMFGIFCDGLHGHLEYCLPHAGLQLGSDRWVSALVYADNVLLLSWMAAGLQSLLDSMHAFCLGLGLIISPSKIEVVICNGSSSDTWRVWQHVLPQSASYI